MKPVSQSAVKTDDIADSTAPASPKRLGRRSAKESKATRQLLLAAAAATFAERGLSGATLDGIAKRAGVTKGAIYSHFSGREDLLIESCRSALKSMPLFRAANEAADLFSFFDETRQALLAPDSKNIRMLIIELHLSAARSEAMANLLREWHSETLDILRDSMSSQIGSPETVMQAIYFLFLGICHVDAFGDSPKKRDEFSAISAPMAKAFLGI